MIPRDYITEWRKQAPWIRDFQVEQDLVIARALVEMFSHPILAEWFAFRGGTALYKLHLKPPARYSEDIDLVQLIPGPVGPMMDAMHEVVDPWLGKPQWKQTEGRVTFVYRFESEDTPPLCLRLKVERDCDRKTYKFRNEIERLFRRLKGYRRTFKRFDKLDATFLGFLNLALVVELICDLA